jgi:hypothetical protein
MTLLVRDEADVVDAQIAFHLHAGVDFVIATDNRSQDGTTDVLERYAKAGVLHLLRERGDDMRQSEWVTRMARLAATEFGADWVINADADEFWWPREASLAHVFEAVPRRYGVVRGCWRHFRPSAGCASDAPFYERMTVRLARPAHPGDKATIFHAHQKVAHRARASVVVDPGNHSVTGPDLAPLRGWLPLEVLHFSFRSVAQLASKAARDWDSWSRSPHGPTLHHVLAFEASRDGKLGEYFDSLAVGSTELERGLQNGTLAIDTRLRDVLRAIREDDGSYCLPDPRARPRVLFQHPTVAQDAAYAAEASPLAEIDGIVRAENRVDALERRLARLEREPSARLHRLAPR